MQRAVGISPAEVTSHDKHRFYHIGRVVSAGKMPAARFLVPGKGLACRKGVCYEPVRP